MTQKRHQLSASTLLFLAAMLLLAACGRQGTEPVGPSGDIAFAPRWTAARATLVTTETQVTDFRASAFVYDGSWPPGNKESYFGNLTVTRASNYDTGYPWLGSGDRKFAFLAVAPANPPTDLWPNKLEDVLYTYNIPVALSDQVDLMGAFVPDVPVDQGTPVALKFRHLLGSLTFTVKGEFETGIIKSLKVKNLKYQGVIELDNITEDGPIRWVRTLVPTDFTIAENVSHTAGTDTPLNADNPLMAFPGIMGDDVSIELVMTVGGTDRTYTVSVAGRGVTAGEKLNVALTPSEITLGGVVLPWTYTVQKTGLLNTEAVRVVSQPYWLYPPSTEHVHEVIGYAGEPTDEPISLNLQFTAPLGVTWRATLTNGLDFWFGPLADIKGGIITEGVPIKITIYPRKPRGDTQRTTEVYFTVGGVEIEPDVTMTAGQETIDWYDEVSYGSGHRFKVIQEAKE